MERKLVLRAVFFFTVCLTSLASGADGGTSLHSNKTLPRSNSANKSLTVFRKEYVELGTTVTLNCTSKKIAWHDMIFVIWKMNLRNKDCMLALAKNDSDHDTCQDGKRQNHTAEGTYHLIIPEFSIQDEGNYTCDISYQSDGLKEIIKVSAWGRPQLSGRLESEQGHTVAVCEATGSTRVSIHWETPWNLSSPVTQAYERAGQVITVSRLHLPQGASHSNITCVATINDLKHTNTRFSNFTIRETHVQWYFILIGVFVILSTLVICIFIRRLGIKKLRSSSIFRKVCSKPEIPASNEEKPQQPAEPEELEFYASYVQRENSIYKSSAELCKA